MKPKTYISLFLLVLFLGKVASVDARGFTLLLESEGVSLLNKICERGNLLVGFDQEPQVQDAEDEVIFEMDFLCQTPVQLLETQWPLLVPSKNFKKHFYLDVGLPRIEADRFYPPPRV